MAFDTSAARSRQFWKPGTVAPGSTVEREEPENDDGSGVIVWNPYANKSLKQQRQALPIYAQRKQILYAVEKYQTLIIVGQTGSGKTTRASTRLRVVKADKRPRCAEIPQYLSEAGWTAGNRAVVSRALQVKLLTAHVIARRARSHVELLLHPSLSGAPVSLQTLLT